MGFLLSLFINVVASKAKERSSHLKSSSVLEDYQGNNDDEDNNQDEEDDEKIDFRLAESSVFYSNNNQHQVTSIWIYS